MNKIRSVLVCSRGEFCDLTKNLGSTSFLVLDVVEAIYNNEEICFLICCVPEEFFGRESEMVLRTHNKDNYIDLFLSSEYRSCLQGVHIETRGIYKRDIDNPVP